MKRNIKTYDRYHIQITNKQGHKWSVDESEYQMMGQSDNIAKIRITPVPRGSGGSAFGWFQTVVGAVLMVASIWVPALAPLGLSLMMGGIAQIISPQATNESVRQADNSNSYYFDGPQNTTNPGEPCTAYLWRGNFSWLTGREFFYHHRPAYVIKDFLDMEQFKKKKLPLLIAGAGGKKSKSSSRTPVEADDTVNSRAMAAILDLLGEGLSVALVNGAKSIFIDDLPILNEDGSSNFSGITWDFRDGSQDQTPMAGFDFVETPKSVNIQLKKHTTLRFQSITMKLIAFVSS